MNNNLILSIESSCDETAAAVVAGGRRVLSSLVASQVATHALYGGVVPEIASRQHLESISFLAEEAVKTAGIRKSDLCAVAVTNTPGLIGALLVGVSFAKGAALSLGVPLVPVHHLKAHIAAAYLAYPELEPPFCAVVISGGNTVILDVADYTVFRVLGRTRDDAAGECFDKTARILGLGYPGGKPMNDLATAALRHMTREQAQSKYPLPNPEVEGRPLEMSFSGLKTAMINTVHNAEQKGAEINREALALSLTASVCRAIVPRAVAAARQNGRDKIVVCGGVAANSFIRDSFADAAEKNGRGLFIPPLSLCGDNAAMVGAQGWFELQSGNVAEMTLNGYASGEF
ncbi:MAG: tRNA (adenosine(37)-N6)-threonylcarbamoyltransferase complex transferase subunit TsaD [Oscillospiraceae bacterium]|jgi:N6-L-threonylcarbamoyladenine synthase|nr:tRNA (adenosine(37)-N6)-threonylcarbamoyltransferase complex transferase subunit TsaD [Oscillospiraceae bacterium]